MDLQDDEIINIFNNDDDVTNVLPVQPSIEIVGVDKKRRSGTLGVSVMISLRRSEGYQLREIPAIVCWVAAKSSMPRRVPTFGLLTKRLMIGLFGLDLLFAAADLVLGVDVEYTSPIARSGSWLWRLVIARQSHVNFAYFSVS